MRNIFKDDNKVRVSQTSITTFVGEDTKVEGTLITHSSVRIDGKVIGGSNPAAKSMVTSPHQEC